MSHPHGIKALSIVDDDSTSGTYGTVVQLSDLDAEAFSFVVEKDDTGYVDSYGNRSPATTHCLCEAENAALTGQSQLESWKADGVPVKAVGYGGSWVYQWYEEDRMREARPTDVEGRFQGQAGFRVAFERTMESPTIHRQVNAVAHLADASGTSYTQTILFPVEGATLTLSATAGGTQTLQITAKNSAGATIDSSSQNVTDSRGSVSHTLPANTHDVEISVSGGTSVSDVAVRVDGETTYVDY